MKAIAESDKAMIRLLNVLIEDIKAGRARRFEVNFREGYGKHAANVTYFDKADCKLYGVEGVTVIGETSVEFEDEDTKPGG